MSKPEIILIGAGGHAKSCIDVIELHDKYQISGLVGLPEQKNKLCFGYEVIATDDELTNLAKKFKYALVTVGQIITPERRIDLFNLLIRLGFSLPIIVSTKAHVSRNATIGNGTIIMHGAIVNVGAEIGENCIINTGAIIEHETVIESHCHISTRAVLNGGVHVGEGSFIGSGSIVKENVSIGEKCIIGMGLSVRHDLKEQTSFIGFTNK